MRKLLGGIAAVVLALGLVGVAAAAPNDGTSPQTAIPLVGAPSGSSVGRGSGAYTYYTFNYPGNGLVGTISLSFWPNDPGTANAVGVNAYQNGNLLATMNGVGNPRGTHALSFSSAKAGPVLVQVYNFTAGVPVYFQLGLSGINATSPPIAPTVSPATSPASTSSPSQNDLVSPVSGTLKGNGAGSYAYDTIQSGGSGIAQSVNLTFSPSSTSVASGVYVVAYQNGSQIGTARGTDASSPGNLTAWYIPETIGPVLIQVGNYTPNSTIAYTISP
ncbi:MAG: hypothetical protein ACREOS_07010 [Candidatus Dormibacteraceae bacterium]